VRFLTGGSSLCAVCQAEYPSCGWHVMVCERLWDWSTELSMPFNLPRSFDYQALHVKARKPRQSLVPIASIQLCVSKTDLANPTEGP
jgi:hypothetical protein